LGDSELATDTSQKNFFKKIYKKFCAFYRPILVKVLNSHPGPMITMPGKAAVLKATKTEHKVRRLVEFEQNVVEGMSVSRAAEKAGISYAEARAEAARQAAARYSKIGVGGAVAERGAWLLSIYTARIEELENDIAEARSRLEMVPKSAEMAPEWIRLTKEMREMFAEKAAHEERVAALGSHVPSLEEVKEVES